MQRLIPRRFGGASGVGLGKRQVGVELRQLKIVMRKVDERRNLWI